MRVQDFKSSGFMLMELLITSAFGGLLLIVVFMLLLRVDHDAAAKAAIEMDVALLMKQLVRVGRAARGCQVSTDALDPGSRIIECRISFDALSTGTSLLRNVRFRKGGVVRSIRYQRESPPGSGTYEDLLIFGEGKRLDTSPISEYWITAFDVCGHAEMAGLPTSLPSCDSVAMAPEAMTARYLANATSVNFLNVLNRLFRFRISVDGAAFVRNYALELQSAFYVRNPLLRTDFSEDTATFFQWR